MIAGIKGILKYIDENTAEIDTGAVTYEVFVPQTLFMTVNRIGDEVSLYTHLVVKEDEMSLYGFLAREELRYFKLLITVSGIGPKGALQILSRLTPEALTFAILSKDTKAISKAPGIGTKTAEKLCIELQDKVSGIRSEASGGMTPPVGSPSIGSVKQEVILALTELGFTNSDAYKSVSELPEELDSGEMLKRALKNIGK